MEDSNIQAKLASKEGCSPHLKVFKRNSSITGIYIVGDSRHIRCQGSSVTSAVLQLIALYYVFDIDYPKCYAMVQLAQYYNEFCRKVFFIVFKRMYFILNGFE